MRGAWRDGDPVGDRRFLDVEAPDFELGGSLPGVRVAYETWGRLSPAADNAVLVLHALTGDAHAVGPPGPGQPTGGWWEGLIGPGAPLDSDRFFVVCPNVLGGCQGSTGPSSVDSTGRPWGSRFPSITIRDQVAVEAAFADALGVSRWAAVLGGSMGGMRALEWAVALPERVGGLLFLASGAAATADQIGLQNAQLTAIRSDPLWSDGDFAEPGPVAGMALARRMAHLSYRAERELDERFGHAGQESEDPLRGGRFSIQSYLDHHAAKLQSRYDARTYVTLTEAMNTHDVGRGRGGVAAALSRVTARTIVAGVDSDRLYPIRLQQEAADLLPGCDALRVVRSEFGHDGFLLEIDQIGLLVRELLEGGA